MLGLQPHLLLHLNAPRRDLAAATHEERGGQRQTPEPSSVLLGKWFISGRSSVEGSPCCKQRLLYEMTISGLKAIQADPFQGSYQLGQCRTKLPFVLAHQLARV